MASRRPISFIQRNDSAAQSKSDCTASPIACANKRTHEADANGVPTRLEKPCGIERGTSREWDDPRAGVNLELALRRRTARVAAYERKNRPSIVAHLAPAFQGKNTLYGCSTRKSFSEGPSLDGATLEPRVRDDIDAILGGHLRTSDFIAPNAPSEDSKTTRQSQCDGAVCDVESVSLQYRPRGLRSSWLTDSERLAYRQECNDD